MPKKVWTEEELHLAAYWYYKSGFKQLDDTASDVIELSRILRSTEAFHSFEGREPNFRSPSSVSLKIRNIADTQRTQGPKSNGSKGDAAALRAFLGNPQESVERAKRILELVELGVRAPMEDSLDDNAFQEGGLLLVQHYKRERNPKARAKKLELVRESGQAIACEVCKFDFEKTYGSRGAGYIEVHHVTPLHIAGISKTRMQDLALLCSNCHRMIHREKNWITPDELKSLIESESN